MMLDDPDVNEVRRKIVSGSSRENACGSKV